MSRADADELLEIARKAAIINRQKAGFYTQQQAQAYGNAASSSSYSYSRGSQRGSYSTYSAPRARGRGRGRAGHYGAPAVASHKSMVFNKSSTPASDAGSAVVKPEQPPTPVVSTSTDPKATQEDQGNNETAKKTPQTQRAPSEEGEIEDDIPPKPAKSATANPTPTGRSRHRTLVLNGSTATKKAGQEIVINGVTFVSDATGKKLIRKDSTTEAAATSKATPANSTPAKMRMGEQSYVRTKSGNLISVDVVKRREMEAKRKRLNSLVGIVKGVQNARSASAKGGRTGTAEKVKTLCRFFNKTGKCTRGLTCPYLHDSSKVAICPKYLRKSCPLPPSACPLSHEPNAHRMPHCQHFPNCNKGAACPYIHVRVSPAAKVCKDFAELGWCERGETCKERHVWECPEFSETGSCKRPGCKLPHIIRRRAEVPAGIAEGVLPPVDAGEASLEDDSGDTRSRKRSHSVASASSSDSEIDEAALVKKPRFKDALQANADFITFEVSDQEDVEGSDVESDDDEEGSGEEDSDVDGDTTMQPTGISYQTTRSKGEDLPSASDDDESDEDL